MEPNVAAGIAPAFHNGSNGGVSETVQAGLNVWSMHGRRSQRRKRTEDMAGLLQVFLHGEVRASLRKTATTQGSFFALMTMQLAGTVHAQSAS